jgi:hypothetical protein
MAWSRPTESAHEPRRYGSRLPLKRVYQKYRFSSIVIEDPAASCRESSTVRTFYPFFQIRSLTPQQAAGNALAVAVQVIRESDFSNPTI